MKIFLTGASGLVGSALAQAAHRRGHHVIGIVGRFAGELPGVRQKLTLDLTDAAAVTQAVLDHFPDVMVNCAAVADPAQCDADPVRTQALNVALPTQLAALAHHVSARLVHISSEQVFDGTAAPYAVGATPNPLNLYGRQKFASELALQAAAPDFAVTVRAPLLLGNSLAGQRSLHEKLFADWAAGRTPRLYTDEIRQPCTADNLAEVLLELCERRDLLGVFHWAGAAPLTRHEIARRIREHFKLGETAAPLASVSRADRPEEAARRPASLALDLKPLAGLLKTAPESFGTVLDQLVIPPPCRAWYLAQS